MKWIFVLGMLVTGTVNTLTKSLQNQETSTGINGNKELFHFPWTQTLIMYYGESMCMLVFLITLCNKRRYKRELAEEREINQTEVALLIKPAEGGEPKHSKAAPFLFLIPTLLDLIGTTLAGIGLLYTYASVFQMLRGSIIVFSGLLSVVILKRKLAINNWVGIAITVGGLIIVGWSSMLDEQGTYPPSQLLFGNALIVAGQFANAVQMILEEIFLKKRNFPPLLVVGAEGCWGAAVMMLIVLPALYYIPGKHASHYENALDAAVLIKNNRNLLLLVLGYWLSIAFYNFCGLSVAKKLTSVHRTFIDALRTILVWGASLVMWYATHGERGEKWGKHSYIQLIGFMLLVTGTIVYNNVHVAVRNTLWPTMIRQPSPIIEKK